MWWKELYNGHLVDLGNSGDLRLNGIYSPGYKQEEIEKFMTAYYSIESGARAQADKFNLTDYYLRLLSESLGSRLMLEVNAIDRPTILDIGCGFGSTTFPLMELFPRANLIASELSIPMLLVLKEKLVKDGKNDLCALMQLNAEELDFRRDSFDLVVGAAILHHLYDPEKVFAQCVKILKDGGCAVFFEPFENGMNILGLIFREILQNKKSWLLGKNVRNYLKDNISVWQKMKGRDKTDPFFKKADDYNTPQNSDKRIRCVVTCHNP